MFNIEQGVSKSQQLCMKKIVYQISVYVIVQEGKVICYLKTSVYVLCDILTSVTPIP